MSRPTLILLLLFAELLSADDRFAGLDEYVAAAMHRWEAPGAALAVVKDGELVLARAYGVCERGTNRKVTTETSFPIASCAKSFTAAGIALLLDDGKLQWDDPVIKHLPEFQLADPYLTTHVTIRDLLCHRTGLQRGDDIFNSPPDVAAPELLRRISHLKPLAELRTKHIYSSAMYFVADQVIERAAGWPWQQFIADRLCQPLDMRSTTFSVSGMPLDRLALRHWRSDEGIVARPPGTTGGGMYSTVLDLANFIKLQLAEGQFAGQQIISQNAIREMHAMHYSTPLLTRPKDNIYAARFLGSGLGWLVLDYRGRKVVRHGGSWGASVTMIPEENLGVVVLNNIDIEGIAGMLSYDVLDAYLVGPHLAWDQSKWESTWLAGEGPGYPYRPRDEAKAALEKSRIKGTTPSRSLAEYTGTYRSPLYGDIAILHENNQLLLDFAGFKTPLSHWHHEAFYARSPTRITYDWLLTFSPPPGNQITTLVVKHIGWDNDEPDQIFTRLVQVE